MTEPTKPTLDTSIESVLKQNQSVLRVNKDLQETLQKVNKLLEEGGETTKDNLTNAVKQLDVAREELEIVKLVANSIQDRSKIIDQEIKLRAEARSVEEALIREEIRLARIKTDEAKQLLELAEKTGDQEKEAFKKAVERAEQDEKRIVSQLKEIENLKKIDASYEKQVGYGKELAKSMGITSAESTRFGLMFENIDTFLEGAKGIGDGFVSMITPLNILGSLLDSFIDKSKEMTFGIDNAVVSFNKATGATGQYNDLINDAITSGVKYGATSTEIGNALVEASKNIRDFSAMSDGQRRSLIDNVVALERFGISASTATKNIQFLTQNFGMTNEAAERFNFGLKAIAETSGLGIERITSSYSTASSVLSAVGDKSGKVFTELTNIMKDTNLEMSKILAVAEKFDTFDSAAQTVGRLNALLGGPYLSTLQMINEVDPAKRFQMTADAVKEAYGAYDQLEYYQKKALASALGLQDVTDLAAVMADRSDLVLSNPFENMSEAEILKMKSEMKEVNDIMTQFAALGRQMAVSLAGPLGYLKSFLQFLIDYGIAEYLGYMLAGFVGLITIISPILAFASAINGIAAAFGMVRAAWATVQTVGLALKAFFVGNTAAIAAETTAQEVNTVVKAEAAVANEALGASQQKAAAAGKGFNFGLISMAASLALVGAGVLMMGYGISMVIDSITNFVKVLSEMPAEQQANALIALGMALGTLVIVSALAAGALLLVASAGAAAFFPMLGLGLAVTAIGAGALLMGLGFKLAADSVTNLVEVMTRLDVSIMETFAETIAKVADSINDMDTIKLGLATVLGFSMTPGAAAAAPAPVVQQSLPAPNPVGTAAGLSSAMTTYGAQTTAMTTQSTTVTGGNTTIAPAMGGAASGNAGSSGPPIIIRLQTTLELDKKQFATSVNDVNLDRSLSSALHDSIAKKFANIGNIK
jgi:hypothetical protein